MKRTLFAVVMSAALLALSQTASSAVYYQNDEEAALKELAREWADAVVHRDFAKLDKIQAEDFKGNAQGMGFNKRMLREALQSGQLAVAAWTMDDIKVKITGNTAVVSGRSTLTNAKYKGSDFSGEWEWTDRFVKEKNGAWRAVNSQSKLVKK
ncbi:MAG: nuclear transport factor 2 family protein [Acidobacteria bacterium]|nr:nuclear transport factor 2 family protein [Acidobacteriota bacterium]